jgi:polar amino acid transport system substrate-binding protein
MIEKTVILAPKGSGMKINSLDDLKGKVVGAVRGYAYDPKFDNEKGIEKAECNDDAELVKIFAKGRVSLAAGADEGSMKYLCKKAGFEAEVVYVLNEMPSYIAFSKAKGERGKALNEKFSQALRQLKDEGFIKKIESKYF